MIPTWIIIVIIIAIIVVAIMVSQKQSEVSMSLSSVPVVWSDNIEKLTNANMNWRNVIYTSDKLQISLMSVPPNEELGSEVHPENDQFFRIESGQGKLVIGKSSASNHQEFLLTDGSAAVVPHGIWHNVINTSATDPLKLYTLYGPPHHPLGTMHSSHAEEISREKS